MNAVASTEMDFEPRHLDMARHIASGVFSAGMLQIVMVLCQFGSVIVLSRLLSPSEFGLMAMASPVFGFVTLFQDLGLSQATIQKPTLSHAEVNVFFWINVAIGAVLMVFIMAVSPLVGRYYGEPRVALLTAAMGWLMLVGALGNQPRAILTRRMEFQIQSIYGALGAICSLMASIVAAFFLKNYWALYCGMVAGSLVPTAGIWFASGWKPSAPRRISGLHDMLKFGAGITGSNIASFFSCNTDNILIGRRWGDHTLGLYDRAYKLLLFPIQRIAGPVMSTLVPVLSRLNAEPDRYRSVFLKITANLTLLAWPGIIWAIVLNDTLIPLLLGEQWKDSAMIFTPLAFAGLVQIVNNSMGYLYISQGRSGELARLSFIGAALDVSSFVIGLPYGAIGVATAYAISEYLRTPFFWWNVTRIGPIRPRHIIYVILPHVISAFASGMVLTLYRKWVHAPPLFLLAGGLVLSYAIAVFVMLLSRSGRETLEHAWEAGQRLLLHVRR